ncbi:tyrosine-type recombinase/integrase [Microbacterium sp. NPDC089696]|uniref:tyrosine-type recombinase/integrase n=1 Tax=Microbacterium sp. NPDC089696 TaxID=3364199 RepID=UPI00382D053D
MLRTGKTPAAAENALKEALRDRLAPAGDVITRDSTLAELAAAWKSEMLVDEKLSDGTKRTYQDALTTILRGLSGVRIVEATPAKLHRYIQAVAQKTPGAARTARIVLKHMMAHAVYAGALTSNPVEETKAVTPRAPNVKALRADDIATIRDLLEAWDSGVDKYKRPRNGSVRDTMDMYAATGARTSEVLALRWPDFSFATEPPTVTLNGTVVRGLDGKLVIQTRMKTDKSHRELELPPFVIPMLTERAKTAYSDLVFPSAVGTPRWPDNLRRDWRAALDGSAYARVTPGAFRKAVATLLSEEMGAEAARDQLGHTGFGNLKNYVERASRGPASASAVQKLVSK